MKKPKTAIIHYWLVGMRGGEKVLESFCRLFPDADIYTHVYHPDAVSETIRRMNVRTTFIQKLPAAARLYKNYLPLMPMALEALDLSGYDLILSSESGPAKGVLAPENIPHVCYVHTPMRYIWNMYHEYKNSAGLLKKMAMPAISHWLRVWDASTACRVDRFVANSNCVARRIKKYWGQDSVVVNPPVDTESFAPAQKQDFYLLAGSLVQYKRPDLAVMAFNRLGKKLVVIGSGEEEKKLRTMAKGNITFLGWQDKDSLRRHLAEARALIFPGEEDFGIIPLEAQASGTPVIAYGQGGALETVVENKTGIFFQDQTEDSLVEAVNNFEANEKMFKTETMVANARKYGRENFERRMLEEIKEVME